MKHITMLVVAMAAAPAIAAPTHCEEAYEVGTLELQLNGPLDVIDIFWSDPYEVSSQYGWHAIAETLAMRYGCGLFPDVGEPWTHKPKDLRRALVAAGDKCVAERDVVIGQLVAKSIKQGVETTWAPTRKLWKCEQRLAVKVQRASPPMSKWEQCLADGKPPSLCNMVN